ncbi:hypothetical protein GMOD_00004983 [Pyrenophora seminiperda CCB06]|uniref:U6 snRNA-associated Sm-like protein LSm6 n=1 Tax=Pyrenophora seminiperda CCB06 TaxID=1302712 RepID=A0A3M7MI08_9PLEO|nr:hypothetical protein GMOD_00004983 [Pyrenophora seminiperda CCB06]
MLLCTYVPASTAVDMSTNGESPAPEAAADARDPSGFLSDIIGAPVTVKLNSGIIYKGDLQSVDGYMNIALERCTEVADGRVTRNWGDAFVRGNNVHTAMLDLGLIHLKGLGLSSHRNTVPVARPIHSRLPTHRHLILSLTMAVPKVKSRIQFQSRQKHGGPRNNKQRIAVAQSNQTSNTAHGSKEADEVGVAKRKWHASSKGESQLQRGYTLSGAIGRVLRAAALEPLLSSIAGVSNFIYSTVNQDYDPNDSLISQAPRLVPVPEENSQDAQELPLLLVAKAKTEASTTWHQWLVSLFAGRKAIPSARNGDRTEPSAALNSACQQQLQPAKGSEETTLVGVVSAPSAPRLTLQQATVRAKPSPCLSYREILPGRTTRYTGYAVVAPGEHQAAIVQRGFNVLGSQQQTPTASRRMNSANSLLDRGGDAWTVWSRTNPVMESKYFTRTRSDTPLLHPQSEATISKHFEQPKVKISKLRDTHI